MRLDNAAKIYPAARSENWSSVYRLSVTLTEDVDRNVLQEALDITVKRFPSIACRLQKGLFWYYLEELEKAPSIMDEYCHPLSRMSREEVSRCGFRIIVYKNRIALELFHSLTDGSGAMVFLKTLTAQYLEQKYGLSIPATDDVLDRKEAPKPEELEDCFPKFAGPVPASRKEHTAWPIQGTEEENGFLHVTAFRLSLQDTLAKAHQYDVSLTAFLCAVMMRAIMILQEEKVPNPKKRKPIKVQIPVNLRRLFHVNTLRNFSLYTNPELLPKLGHYDFGEICRLVKHHMGLYITPKMMQMVIAANVGNEQMTAVRLMPLFIKNAVMKAVFNAVGEKLSCLSMSNLGAVTVPEKMKPFITRFDFILGVQAAAPYNCGVLSYENHLILNFIRNIKEPFLERAFYQALQEQDLMPELESNDPSGKE